MRRGMFAVKRAPNRFEEPAPEPCCLTDTKKSEIDLKSFNPSEGYISITLIK